MWCGERVESCGESGELVVSGVMRERGVWVEREVCKMSLRFTKRKKVHILKTLDQRDLAYNSDDFPVPNVVA